MLLYRWLSARLRNGKNVQNGLFYYVIYFTARNVDIFILFTNIPSFHLYFKEAQKVLFETNKYVMDFRFSFSYTQ